MMDMIFLGIVAGMGALGFAFVFAVATTVIFE